MLVKLGYIESAACNLLFKLQLWDNMNCKCIQGGGLFILVLCTLILPAYAEPNNGGFELFDYNDILGFNIPTGWIHDANYAAVVDYLAPRQTQWKLKTNLLPFEGDHFLLLSTGKEDILRVEPNSAKIYQTITVETGDKLTGVYFFGTRDYIINYPLYNDWAEITLIHPTDPNLDKLIVYVTVKEMGSYGTGDSGSMSGWKRFEHTFEPNDAGTYDLTIRACDYSDSVYDTFFAVDNLILCKNPPQASDISCDCTVNFDDFTYIAADWLFNCKDPNVLNDPISDPNFYNDPNSNCLLGTDLNNDGPVDIKDLAILSENWLQGTKE